MKSNRGLRAGVCAGQRTLQGTIGEVVEGTCIEEVDAPKKGISFHPFLCIWFFFA